MDSITREKLEKLNIDMEDALDRLMGDEDLLLALLKDFPRESEYELFVQAMQEKRYDDAFKAAHSLKGLCGNLSVTTLSELVSREVEYLRRHDYENACTMLPELAQEYEKDLSVMKSL